MEHIDHDYLSTQVIKIPSKSKTSFSSSYFYILKISRAFHSGAVFIMQNVLPRSGARAYTVSDYASADQRYTDGKSHGGGGNFSRWDKNYRYGRTPLIRPPSESHWCGRMRGMVAREGFI